MTGRQTLELKVMTAGLLTAGVLCWFAIPAYGQLGAAVATCSSIAVANFLRLYFASRRIGRLPFGIDLVGITAVGLGAALLCEVAAAATDLPALWGTITRIALFLCAYVAVSWFFLLREFEKRGIRAVVGRLCTRTVALASSSTHR
jgi:O-antigen/teichoic acid export membrane protein